MKKLLSLLLIGVLLALAAAPSALAAQFTDLADALNAVDLFRGTGSGYALDRAPTRAEAAAILVRLLGKDAEAQSGTYTHPFEDVPAWADGYVGYLSAHQLTNGVSATHFAPDATCSAQMLAAFALRALGYSEAEGDFTYDGVLAFAEELGLLNDDLLAGDFHRDEAVAVMYNALFTPQKGADVPLLTALAAEDAVPADAPLVSQAKLLQMLNDAIAADPVSQSEAISVAVTTHVLTEYSDPETVGLAGATSVEITSAGNVTVISKDGKLVGMAQEITAETHGESIKTQAYWKDNVMYMDVGGQRVKTDLFGQDIADNLPDVDSVTNLSDLSRAHLPSYLVSKLSMTADGGGTRFSFAIPAETMQEILDVALQSVSSMAVTLDPEADPEELEASLAKFNMEIGPLLYEIAFDADGRLKEINIELTTEIPNLGGMRSHLRSTILVAAYGDAVTIEFPDLANWESEAA
ncbi:MAG: hypothetical protein LBK75_09480 [Oscillospiraceae bacterium]|jgi:hypothetical protein|nr:hypothetical protein [Oscillospiraceae bacterium]